MTASRTVSASESGNEYKKDCVLLRNAVLFFV